MTVSTGHPDFQQFAQGASGNIFPALNQTLPPGATTFGPFPVASWSSMALSITPSAGNAVVNVQHWADAAGTLNIGTDGWPVNAATKLFVITPLRGPFVSITITAHLGVNLVATTWGQFRSDGAQHITFPVGYQNAGAHARSLAANGTDFWLPLTICAGRAHFNFTPADATGKLHARIYAQTDAGVFMFFIADYGFPVAPVNALLEVPDQCLVVEIDNTDGAAPHTYDTQLIIPPQ